MEKETYWSKFAENFDIKQKYVTGEVLFNQIHNKLKELKNLGDVLEFACGNGGYTESIANAANSVRATDYSIEMVEQAARRFNDNKKIKVEQADCHKTGYPGSSFDTVFMAHLIHIIDRPEEVIKESWRLLKPGGTLIILSFTTEQMSFFAKLGLLYRFKKTFGKLPETRTDFKLKELSELAGKNNFKIINKELLGNKVRALYLIAKK